MLNRKSLIGKLFLGLAGVLAAYLLILGTLRVFDAITKRIPISESQILLAQAGVTQNKDWQPVIRQFDDMEWALVPAGCFNLGSTESQLAKALGGCKVYGSGECQYVFDLVPRPDAQVCFEKPYWINATEVTNRQYGSGFGADMNVAYPMQREANWPRDTIKWQDANQYCVGISSRLPTEAEWEYAARGPDGLTYPWGNEISPAYQQQAHLMRPQAVDSIEADTSWVGAMGFSGNVTEWVADLHSDQHYARGGSWASYAPFLLRTTQRLPHDPKDSSSLIGFRCVRDFENIQ